MDLDSLFHQYQAGMEDYWGRRQSQPAYGVDFRIFGVPFRLSSNDERALAAAHLSSRLYSTAPPSSRAAFSIQIVLRDHPQTPGPPPEDLDRCLQNAGDADWLNLHYGSWGSCFVNMAAGWAVAVLAPELAGRPDLISRFMLNTVINNFLTRHGFSMLHTTALVKKGRFLLLMAPHGSGKSTTAMRLMLAGYSVLSDSQVYVAFPDGKLQLTGFPVGRLKLREDMASRFPQVKEYLTPELVRDEIKYILDLYRFVPERVFDRAASPATVDLFLLERNGKGETDLSPAPPGALWEAIVHNSLHYDAPGVWADHLSRVQKLLERVRGHHLSLGARADGIVEAVNSIWAK
jgi:hypothetical protein